MEFGAVVRPTHKPLHASLLVVRITISIPQAAVVPIAILRIELDAFFRACAVMPGFAVSVFATLPFWWFTTIFALRASATLLEFTSLHPRGLLGKCLCGTPGATHTKTLLFSPLHIWALRTSIAGAPKTLFFPLVLFIRAEFGTSADNFAFGTPATYFFPDAFISP